MGIDFTKNSDYFEVLRKAQNHNGQKTLADELGLSIGKVNFILNALIQKGLVKVERFKNSKNRVQYSYLLTPEGIKEKLIQTENFISRKKAEYDELQKELEDLKVNII